MSLEIYFTPITMYGYERRTVKKSDRKKIDSLKYGVKGVSMDTLDHEKDGLSSKLSLKHC